MMRKKDYVTFAEMLRAAPSFMAYTDSGVLAMVDHVRDRIADIFAADNPRFDRERFERACRGE